MKTPAPWTRYRLAGRRYEKSADLARTRILHIASASTVPPPPTGRIREWIQRHSAGIPAPRLCLSAGLDLHDYLILLSSSLPNSSANRTHIRTSAPPTVDHHPSREA
jgi:hypothetical protein